MNKLLILAGLFLLCAAMNLVNVLQTGNGFSLVLGGVWLVASVVSFLRYRREKKGNEQEEKA